jgi:FlaG/FlaF family flagellin (archaellin)
LKRIRVSGRSDAAASPVIGEVLMVAIVIVLSAVVYIMVSGMLTFQDEDKVTMTMSFPDVQAKSRGATPTPVWDVTLDITKVIPDDYKLVWSDVYISIKAADGSLLKSKSGLTPDNPAMYDCNDTDGIDVELWYVEASTSDSIVSGGDSIKVTGMDIYYEGCTIQLTKAGELIAQVDLPTNFQ